MPTYDYLCDNCGHEFEKFQMMSDSLMRKCPKCKKFRLKRLIGTGAGIIFKGSGFYETDYRSENYKQDQKQSKSTPETAKKDKKEIKTESKKSAASTKTSAGKEKKTS